MSAQSVPTTAVSGVVLLTGDDPFIAIATREGLYAGLRIGVVIVRATGNLGEGESSETISRCSQYLAQPLAFLLIGTEADDGLQTETGGEHGGRHVDVDGGQFFGRQSEIEGRQSGTTIGLRDERVHKALLRHRGIERTGGEEAFFGLGEGRDGRPHLGENFAGEAARSLLQGLLRRA